MPRYIETKNALGQNRKSIKNEKPHISVRLLKNKKATTYSPWGLTKYHQRGGA